MTQATHQRPPPPWQPPGLQGPPPPSEPLGGLGVDGGRAAVKRLCTGVVWVKNPVESCQMLGLLLHVCVLGSGGVCVERRRCVGHCEKGGNHQKRQKKLALALGERNMRGNTNS